MLSPLQGSLISFELLYCITIKTFTINRNIGYISIFYIANLVWAWTIVQCEIVLKLWLMRYNDIQVLIYPMIGLSLYFYIFLLLKITWYQISLRILYSIFTTSDHWIQLISYSVWMNIRSANFTFLCIRYVHPRSM